MSASLSRRDAHGRIEQLDDEARRARDVIGFGFASNGTGRLSPDERELTALLGRSRQSVRSGLELLREEGIIERRRGLGTFVVPKAPIDMLGVSGLGHDVAPSGQARYRTLFLGACTLPSAVARLLGASSSDPLVLVQRLSLLDDRPVCVWDHYVARRLVDLAHTVLEIGESDSLLEELLGLEDGTIDLHAEAGFADASVAELLQVNVGQPLLRYERVVKDAKGLPALIGFGYSRGAPTFQSVPIERKETRSQ